MTVLHGRTSPFSSNYAAFICHFGSHVHKRKCKETGQIFPSDQQPELHTSSAAKYHSHLSKNNIFVAVGARNFLNVP